MHPWLLALLSPLLFILPGLLPSRLVTGRFASLMTLAWAVFFSVLFLPLVSFAAAMLLQTTVRPALVFPIALVMGLPGLFLPDRFFRCRG